MRFERPVTLILSTLLALSVVSCDATTDPTGQPPDSACSIFVSASGTDDGSGGLADPLRTVQAGVERAGAGDIVCVAAGDYTAERVRIDRSGEPGRRLTIRAEGRVTTRGFTIRADYVEVSGFEVTNRELNDPIDGHGIFLEGEGIVVSNNYIHDTYANGINCWHRDPYCAFSEIIGNTVERADGTGIRVFGVENLIELNDVSHSIRENADDADGIRFFGDGHTIRYNFIHDIYDRGSSGEGPHTDCFQTFDNNRPPTRDIIIDSNRCHDVDHQCLMASAEESAQEGQIGRSRHIIFRNNICDNNGGQALNVLQFPELVVVNNLFLNNIQYRAIYLRAGSSAAVIQNNIFYGDYMHYEGENANPGSGLEADYNLRYSPGGGAAYPWDEPNGLWEVDPRFENSTDDDFLARYRLLASSPAIDAGTFLYVSPFDLAGEPRVRDGDGDGFATPDIGPYEHQP